MKVLEEDGEGKFNVIRLEQADEAAAQVEKDEFIAKNYVEATEEEYTAQMEAAGANIVEPVEAEAPAAVEPAADVAAPLGEGVEA